MGGADNKCPPYSCSLAAEKEKMIKPTGHEHTAMHCFRFHLVRASPGHFREQPSSTWPTTLTIASLLSKSTRSCLNIGCACFNRVTHHSSGDEGFAFSGQLSGSSSCKMMLAARKVPESVILEYSCISFVSPGGGARSQKTSAPVRNPGQETKDTPAHTPTHDAQTNRANRHLSPSLLPLAGGEPLAWGP